MSAQHESITGNSVQMDGERYFQITNTHLMPEFFMSLVGSSDHWMFISSLGALTAGRCDPDLALFPYAADDQISAARATTGPYTSIRIHRDGETFSDADHWEPFHRATPRNAVSQNLYKTALGNKLILEEIHHGLGLTFRYRWTYSEKFGFVRSSELINHNEHEIKIDLIDGLQNLIPYGLGSEFTMRFSNLGNAYKKSERLKGSDLGIFYLSSIPTDRAEPSEGLKATTVWQTGLNPDKILISTQQIPRHHSSTHDLDGVSDEYEARGKQGAFLACKRLTLGKNSSQKWHIVADVQQDHGDIIARDSWIKKHLLEADCGLQELEHDIQAGELHLREIISSADGFQCGSNLQRLDRHTANTIFNVMRGGVPLDAYSVPTSDLKDHLKQFNGEVYKRNLNTLDNLPETVCTVELRRLSNETGDKDLIRLVDEYLPLTFSRRHGDPTRPWNRFAIRLKTESGETNLSYQGNWRDIFQNWEALAVSFPNFSTAMISRFLNATTADGYNPYRVTKDGFEWEAPTPDDPWANIGYWGDHQIIYLLKLMEFNKKTHPHFLHEQLGKRTFVHANIPYRIKNFESIKKDPSDTIEFDYVLHDEIEKCVEALGSDGKLLRNPSGELLYVSMLEKIFTLTLAKLSNFIPDGGIWLNTQRPEWNDANNALVGNGLSMVTTCYLYRWCVFMEELLKEHQQLGTNSEFEISVEVATFFDHIYETLKHSKPSSSPSQNGELTTVACSPSKRAEIVSQLGQSGSDFRDQLYNAGLSGKQTTISINKCSEFFEIAKDHLKHTINNNEREDSLFHSYNLIRWENDEIFIDHLDEMLEGQVAALSAGLLDPPTTADLLDSLRNSKLYRENQNSYILYPDQRLPNFLSKNSIPESTIAESELLQRLLKEKDQSIIKQDLHGGHHFNGAIRNANDLSQRLSDLPSMYQEEVSRESTKLLETFVDIFNHHEFTGRSGTFFGYEGLGSIYWHMVSKLNLAVAENFFRSLESDTTKEVQNRLLQHYQDIREGIGSEKSPADYGAFPSDPYSHTPENAGVKQPGMTGQVKEDVLSRFLETGIQISDGCIHFCLDLFDPKERLQSESTFNVKSCGEDNTTVIPAGGFGLTLCQTPIIYRPAEQDRITVHLAGNREEKIDGSKLTPAFSQEVFARSGVIHRIEFESTAIASSTN